MGRTGLGRRARDLMDALPRSTPLVLILVIVAISFERVLTQHWRQGATLLGGAMLAAAVMRAVLADARVGLLAVRGRLVDVIIYTSFGLVLIALAVTVTRLPLVLG